MAGATMVLPGRAASVPRGRGPRCLRALTLAAAAVACACCAGRALWGSSAAASSSVAGLAFVVRGDEPVGVGGYGAVALTAVLAVFYGLCLNQSNALGAEEAKAGEPAAPAEGAKKPRIDAFDSLRFFLIAYIASGHFIQTSTRNPLLLKLIAQINVVVGAFFVLSGYVAAYTTTELGQRKGSKRLDNAVEFAVTRILGFWPLHVLVLLLFSPMFFWVDATYSGLPTALWNAFISTSLLQAWFPLSAEVWNAPTWFLSAFSFCLFVLPFALRVLATLRKAELRKALVFLTLLSLVPRLSYSYDLKAWGIMEGTLSARTHPNYALFNAVRFSPFGAVLEVLMGAVACRLVMLDSGRPGEAEGASFPVLVAMLGIMGLRAGGFITLNDMLVRSVAFIPLWVVFLMRIHRESVGAGGLKALPRLLCYPKLLFLGSISFPIFIVHGPIGQAFFKKAVAMKLWGGMLATPLPNGVHWFFGVYWLTVIVAATLLDKFFMQSNWVKEASKNLGIAICKRF